MTVHKIKVEVTGTEEDKVLALSSLIETMEWEDINDALDNLSVCALVKVAKSVHGRMYNKMKSW